MTEAVRISETSVYSNETTRRCIPEDYNLYTRRRENLTSHMFRMLLYAHSVGDISRNNFEVVIRS
jgi:hypothetical protein